MAVVNPDKFVTCRLNLIYHDIEYLVDSKFVHN